MEVIHIENIEQALKHRSRDAAKTRSIYVMTDLVARGYDLKLGKDASVLVLADDKGYPWSLVNQMFGRGSRSFGVSRGFYFTHLFPAKAVMKDQLIALEKDFKDSALILEMLYDSMPLLKDSKEIKSLYEFFKHPNKWQTTVNKLQQDYPGFYDLIARKKAA